MKHHKTLILIFALLMAQFCRAEVSQEKREEIDKLLQLTGMTNLANQMISQMIASMKPTMPDAPDVFWSRLADKMDTGDLIERIVPIYDKYYTIEDLRAINTFYSSEAGKKILSTLPQVMQESMAAGQAWGQKATQQAIRETKDEVRADPK